MLVPTVHEHASLSVKPVTAASAVAISLPALAPVPTESVTVMAPPLGRVAVSVMVVFPNAVARFAAAIVLPNWSTPVKGVPEVNTVKKIPSGVSRTSYSRDLHYFAMSECRILGTQ